MTDGKYKATLGFYTMGRKDDRAPYVKLSFSFIDEVGKEQSLYYLGSLSDKARPYTLERLEKIGYKGKLDSFNEIKAFISGEAGLPEEGYTIGIESEEYNGKSRFKVKWFSLGDGPMDLSDDEIHRLATTIFNYGKKSPKKEAPKKQSKPKPKVDASQFETFDESEELSIDGDDYKPPF